MPLVSQAKTAQKNKRMRLFRRARDTKTSVVGREADAGAGDRARMPSPVEAPPASSTSRARVPAAPPSYEAIEDSDVFVCKKAEGGGVPTVERAPVSPQVTLFVHRWHNVEPGLLSWTFPSLRSALDAVQRMKNAIGWCVVSGTGWDDLESARVRGAVLVEQL